MKKRSSGSAKKKKKSEYLTIVGKGAQENGRETGLWQMCRCECLYIPPFFFALCASHDPQISHRHRLNPKGLSCVCESRKPNPREIIGFFFFRFNSSKWNRVDHSIFFFFFRAILLPEMTSLDKIVSLAQRKKKKITHSQAERMRRCFPRLYAALPQLTVAEGGLALPALGFDWKDGCKPTFSARQVELHYTKHHQAYVDKYNALAKGRFPAGTAVEEVVKKTADAASDKVIFNQAAQHFNHSFFWFGITPNGSPMPAELAAAIDRDFGSFQAFKEKFQTAGLNNFGSGWTWLVYNPTTRKLEVENTGNAGCPVVGGNRPLFTADVWEHAYYKDFENRRLDYLADLWKVANWKWVGEQYANAIKA